MTGVTKGLQKEKQANNTALHYILITLFIKTHNQMQNNGSYKAPVCLISFVPSSAISLNILTCH